MTSPFTFTASSRPLPAITRAAIAALAIAAWLCPAPPAAAIVNGEEVDPGDARLDAVAILISAAEGAPACFGGVAGSCVLVAPNIVMTAAHALLQPDGTPWPELERDFWVRFRRGVSGVVSNSFPGPGCAGDFQERRVVSISRLTGVGGADIALCVLESAPEGIEPLGVEYRREPAAGEAIIIAGWGFAGECLGGGDPWQLRRAGGTLAAGAQGSLLPINECALTPCVACTRAGGAPPEDASVEGWAVPNLHDSGAPVIVEAACLDGGTELRVLGVVMTPTYAVRARVWHEAGGQPALFSPIPCGTCIADHNEDGARTLADVFSYISDYFARQPRADVDGLAGIAVPDLFVFLAAWFAGCP